MKITIDFFEDEKNVKTVPAGETIFQEGDPGDVMYGIREGTVEIVSEGRVLETVGPGGIFGEMALVDGAQRSATVVAQTDCTLVPIDEANFFFRVQHNPIFAQFVMQAITERLRHETRR